MFIMYIQSAEPLRLSAQSSSLHFHVVTNTHLCALTSKTRSCRWLLFWILLSPAGDLYLSILKNIHLISTLRPSPNLLN